MAKSLFEKLGLLVRSSVTDFVAEVGDRLPDLTLPRTGELDYEVDALRKRVNEALDYLKGKLQVEKDEARNTYTRGGRFSRRPSTLH